MYGHTQEPVDDHRFSRGCFDARNHTGIQEYLRRRSGEQNRFIFSFEKSAV